MNKIVAITGLCGAGKTTVALYLQDKGYQYIRFGQIVIAILKERGLPINADNERMIRTELRQMHGMAAFAAANVKKIETCLAKGNVVIDGLYSFAEYKLMKDEWDKQFITLAVYAPPSYRYRRLASRVLDQSDTAVNNRPLTREQAKARDYDEIENADKGGPIAIADWTIVNTESLMCLRGHIEEFLHAQL